ncbi:MAG: carboxypeptidase regulatory-like domain-containing protein [Pirellulales bacterium]|nr:carboxypeptidase regulatory-like domain-containing protein [Pirellulales bacterium]
MVSVEGTVTLNEKPVVGALVSFQPDDPMASPSYGETDEKGHYVLKFSPQRDGAMIGMHTVSITTKNENLKKPETLPPQFNEQSELKKEVKDGENVIDFPIKL